MKENGFVSFYLPTCTCTYPIHIWSYLCEFKMIETVNNQCFCMCKQKILNRSTSRLSLSVLHVGLIWYEKDFLVVVNHFSSFQSVRFLFLFYLFDRILWGEWCIHLFLHLNIFRNHPFKSLTIKLNNITSETNLNFS